MDPQGTGPESENRMRLVELEQLPGGNYFSSDIWMNMGEEFRNIRTRIYHAFGEQKNKVILVTSAAPREGKTLVAVNLARAFAEASWRTLLMDADMRAPTLHSSFRFEDDRGLSDILQNEKLINEFIWQADIPDLHVMAAGSKTDKPAELVNSSFMSLLLTELRSRYDFVVIDTPPMMPVTDTLVLSRRADGIILVIENHETPRQIVKETVEQLQGQNILGIILNGVARPKKYYGYY